MSIADILSRVNENKSGIYNRKPDLIVILPEEIALIIGDNKVHLSEFIVAKVKGLIKGFKSHPEITDEIWKTLPHKLCCPDEILRDTRSERIKYLFINFKPIQQIVIEIKRLESGVTEINTVFEMSIKEQRRLEHLLKTAYKAPLGDAPTSPCMPRD